MRPFAPAALVVALLTTLFPSRGAAQHAAHAAHSARAAAGDSTAPATATTTQRRATLPGQDAFGAIAEIVRILKGDSATDWSTVNIEALRQHLIDMNDVTLNSEVRSVPVPGGVQLTVTGSGRTVAAIRRMVTSHGHMLAAEGLEGSAEPVVGGVRWRVTTTDPSRVDEVRALGFIGIMTLGEHHTTHHLMLARGGQPH